MQKESTEVINQDEHEDNTTHTPIHRSISLPTSDQLLTPQEVISIVPISSPRVDKSSTAAEVSIIRINPQSRVEQTMESNNIKLPINTYSLTKIVFSSQPKTAFIVKQWNNENGNKMLIEIADHLERKYGVKTKIEGSAREEDLKRFGKYESIDEENPASGIDFCIVLGGDGTYLHLNSLFQEEHSIPPVLGLALGSLGFLLPYSVEDYERHIASIMKPEPDVVLRLRLTCETHLQNKEEEIDTYQILNDVVFSRGTSPFLTLLELVVDGETVTHIQADGIIISSPTGSTAYSLSAGGTIVPPVVPAILITPICPHSLSFRPLILPDCCKIEIRVPKDARSEVSVSYDGRVTKTLGKGDFVVVKASPYPVATFNTSTPLKEWFNSVNSRLHWNLRETQKPLPTTTPTKRISKLSKKSVNQ